MSGFSCVLYHLFVVKEEDAKDLCDFPLVIADAVGCLVYVFCYSIIDPMITYLDQVEEIELFLWPQWIETAVGSFHRIVSDEEVLVKVLV